MTNVLNPFQLLVIALAGWLNRHQQAVIDYLIVETVNLMDGVFGLSMNTGNDWPLTILESSLVSINCRQIWHHSFPTVI